MENPCTACVSSQHVSTAYIYECMTKRVPTGFRVVANVIPRFLNSFEIEAIHRGTVGHKVSQASLRLHILTAKQNNFCPSIINLTGSLCHLGNFTFKQVGRKPAHQRQVCFIKHRDNSCVLVQLKFFHWFHAQLQTEVKDRASVIGKCFLKLWSCMQFLF